MPRWKTTEQIINLSKDGEVFDENWMNYDKVFQYMPKPTLWTENRVPRFEEIDIWEVISETSGPVGVYAAWQPYAEVYVVTKGWRIVEEFSGWNANDRLEKYLVLNNIPYPKGPDIPEELYNKSFSFFS
jgi:hypothetical protein